MRWRRRGSPFQRSAVFSRRISPLLHLTICSPRIRWSQRITSRVLGEAVLLPIHPGMEAVSHADVTDFLAIDDSSFPVALTGRRHGVLANWGSCLRSWRRVIIFHKTEMGQSGLFGATADRVRFSPLPEAIVRPGEMGDSRDAACAWRPIWKGRGGGLPAAAARPLAVTTRRRGSG